MLHTNFETNVGGTRSASARSFTGQARRAQGLPAVILALLSCFVAVFTTVAQPANSSNRFLFIIDASASMKPVENTVRETVFDLVYSGARGRMTNGDTYGIWVVNEHNDTSFAMEVWKSKHAVESAARAAMHVKERGYKGRARLDVALADAARVVKNVEDLTVILVSNGETPMSSTPFDAEINAKFRELAPQMKRAKATLNTVLVAQEGTFVAWGINSPEFLIEIPYVEPKPKKTKVELAVKTNAMPPVAPVVAKTEVTPTVTKPAEVVALKPRSTAAPIVITKETVEQERRSYQAMTAAAASNEAPIVAAPAPTNPTPVVTAVTNAIAPVTSNTVARATNPITPVVVAKTNPAPASNAVAVVAKPEPTNVVAAVVPPVAPPTKPLPAAKTVEPPATSGFHPMVWAAFGAGLALAGVLAVYFVVRSRRVEPSLISEALAQERFTQQSGSVRS